MLNSTRNQGGAMSNYDTESYNRNVGLLLDVIRDELWYQCETVAAEQNRVAFAYVTLACIAFAAQVWLFLVINEPTNYMRFWLIVGALLEAYVIVTCISVPILNREVSVGIADYETVLSKVYRWGREQDSTRKLNISLIKFFEKDLRRMKLSNLKRRVDLGSQAILLMVSALITILCILKYIVVK